MGAVNKAFIIDWSGTLVDDLDDVLSSVNYVLSVAGGTTLSRQQFRESFFLPIDLFYEKYAPGLTFERIRKIYIAHYERNSHRVVAQIGASELVEEMHSGGAGLFLLSTIPFRHFKQQKDVLAVTDKFIRIYVDIQDKRQGILGLLRENEIPPSSAFMVGDTVYDIEAAHAAGIRSIAVANGYSLREKLAEASPAFLFDDLIGLREQWRRI